MQKHSANLHQSLGLAFLEIESFNSDVRAKEIIGDLMETSEGQKFVLKAVQHSLVIADQGTDDQGEVKAKWWHFVFDKSFRQSVVQLIIVVLQFWANQSNVERWIK